MSGHGRSRWWRVLSVSAMVASMMTGPAWGWGRLGHRLAGRIADDRLSPSARAVVASLLAPGESLADVSTWADEYRRDHSETGPWHYVNVPITESAVSDKFFPKEGCVVTKIPEFRKILADTSAPREDRIKALKFLTHFVQDMHQPVHVGHRNDKGGNDLQVQFFGQGSNLHRVWDSGLLDKTGHGEAEYVGLLEKTITPELANSWCAGGPMEWANESLDAAKVAYKNPDNGIELKSGAKLTEPYQIANVPVAERRVTQAGVRLAWMLNELFP